MVVREGEHPRRPVLGKDCLEEVAALLRDDSGGERARGKPGEADFHEHLAHPLGRRVGQGHINLGSGGDGALEDREDAEVLPGGPWEIEAVARLVTMSVGAFPFTVRWRVFWASLTR